MEIIMNTCQVKKIVFLFIIILCVSCEYETTKADAAPVIYISKMVDTAYLNTFYNSEIVEVEPCEGVTVTGKVNTSKLGTYYLDHDYTDKFGNKSATVMRTVHVVENSTAFLNGSYAAVCSCTALGSLEALVTQENYTATVSSSPLKDHFELINLKIGAEYVIPITYLKGSAIKVDFYRHDGSTASGTVFPAKNSFTIESETSGDSPVTKHRCKNIFTKMDRKEDVSVLK